MAYLLYLAQSNDDSFAEWQGIPYRLPGEIVYEGWLPPAGPGRDRAIQYAPTLAKVEAENDLPNGLLVRVGWQESRFRDDIISGETRSPVGAMGMFQFMPRTAANPGYGVQPLRDPLDWRESAETAGEYLAAMRYRTRSWSEALAAYNWGLGNVQRVGLGAAPRETRDYYGSITSDLDIA